VAFDAIGVLNTDDAVETYFIEKVLKPNVDADTAVLVDIGAHVGKYSSTLLSVLPKAKIYAFEPNPVTFQKLKARFPKGEVECFNMGLGSEAGSMQMYVYADDQSTSHASLFESVLTQLHHAEKVDTVDVAINRLDDICSERGIERIDLLKVDTEGFELEVLKGGSNVIREGRVRIVQFEFNEMNVMSRIYLHDFYDMLPGYRFFRLNAGGLVHLGEYNSANEIFKYHNIIAIDKSVTIP